MTLCSGSDTTALTLAETLKNHILLEVARPQLDQFGVHRYLFVCRYVYDTWDTPHDAATLSFPYPWDKVCPGALIKEPDTREL